MKRSKKISESEKPKAPPPADTVEKKVGEKLIQAEKAETGRVSLKVYLYYIRSIGVTATLITTLSYVLSQACSVGANVWLSALSEENYTDGVMPDSDRDLYLGVYTALGIGQGESSLLMYKHFYDVEVLLRQFNFNISFYFSELL